MYTVYDAGESCLLSEIYKKSGISKQTVNSAIRGLEADNILYLEKHTGRAKRVVLTDKGKEFAKNTVGKLYEAEIGAFGTWTDIPTLVADMINIGIETKNMDYVMQKGYVMLGAALLSDAGTLMGSFLCARLSAKLGRDLRNALYDTSLAFSDHDFGRFGTGSMITRTLNDVNVVQQAIVWTAQMILPVPAMCIIGVVMALSIDMYMGMLLVAVTATVLIGAVFITRKTSFIFEKLQGFLDRINVVLRENITGVRVIRAFNKESYEESRMRRGETTAVIGSTGRLCKRTPGRAAIPRRARRHKLLRRPETAACHRAGLDEKS